MLNININISKKNDTFFQLRFFYNTLTNANNKCYKAICQGDIRFLWYGKILYWIFVKNAL